MKLLNSKNEVVDLKFLFLGGLLQQDLSSRLMTIYHGVLRDQQNLSYLSDLASWQLFLFSPCNSDVE